MQERDPLFGSVYLAGGSAVSTRDRRGFTLAEIIVALSLFAMVSLGMFAAFKSVFAGWQVAQQVTSEQQAARTLLEWLSRRVRLIGVDFDGAGPAIAKAEGNEIRYWMSTQCHRIYLASGVVYEQQGPICGTGTPRPLTSDRDARPIWVTTLAFRYFNAATGGLNPRTSEMPVPVLGDARYAIKRIEIAVGVRGVQATEPPFTMTTQAVMRAGR